MGERVTGEFECASDILKEKSCFLVNDKKRKGLIFMDEVTMRNCPCQVSHPKLKETYQENGTNKTDIVVRTVVRQAGQLFLPVCNHSSTQALWKA